MFCTYTNDRWERLPTYCFDVEQVPSQQNPGKCLHRVSNLEGTLSKFDLGQTKKNFDCAPSQLQLASKLQ